MMGAKFGGDDDDEPIVDINVTPLVDIVLVLLIIFMVTATYIVKPSIKVTLPEAATGEPTESSSLGLYLDKSGQLSLNGEDITEGPLRAAIRAAVTADKEVVCLLAADKDVPHGEVVSLMDLMRQEGVARFAINIDPKEPPPEAEDE
jgi:biopolymer transport protein ExbD